MNDLIYSCTDSLPQPSQPVCATDYGERVVQVIFSKTAVSCTGNVPLASDFNAAYSDLSIFKYITNGHRIFLGETEIEWHNKEWYDKEYRIEGKIRRVNESTARAAEKLSRYASLYMYFFTEKNYCYGPYYAQPNFTLIQLEGKGRPPYIAFNADYIGHGVDYAQYDSGYLSLYEAEAGAILTEEGFDILLEDGGSIILE